MGIHTGSRASAFTIAPHGLVQFVLPYAYGPLFDRPDPNWGVLGGYLGAGVPTQLPYPATDLCQLAPSP